MTRKHSKNVSNITLSESDEIMLIRQIFQKKKKKMYFWVIKFLLIMVTIIQINDFLKKNLDFLFHISRFREKKNPRIKIRGSWPTKKFTFQIEGKKTQGLNKNLSSYQVQLHLTGKG